jgi:hypothetical protein
LSKQRFRINPAGQYEAQKIPAYRAKNDSRCGRLNFVGSVKLDSASMDIPRNDQRHLQFPRSQSRYRNLRAAEGSAARRDCRRRLFSVFLGLYRLLRQGWNEQEAFAFMRSIWQPNEVWSRFIGQQCDKAGGS